MPYMRVAGKVLILEACVYASRDGGWRYRLTHRTNQESIMADRKTGIWIYYESDDQYDKFFGFEYFSEGDEAEKFVNKHPNWHYRAIWGTERIIDPITTVTKLVVRP